MSNWIDVNDRLPPTFKDDEGDEHYEWVIGSDGGEPYIACVQYNEDGTWYMYGDYLNSRVPVRFWQPLPEPPKTTEP